jgi:hypothetical protein
MEGDRFSIMAGSITVKISQAYAAHHSVILKGASPKWNPSNSGFAEG